MPSIDDSNSLKLWVKVVIATPLSAVMEQGFDFIKCLIEKIWTDCRVSLRRRQQTWLNFKRK